MNEVSAGFRWQNVQPSGACAPRRWWRSAASTVAVLGLLYHTACAGAAEEQQKLSEQGQIHEIAAQIQALASNVNALAPVTPGSQTPSAPSQRAPGDYTSIFISLGFLLIVTLTTITLRRHRLEAEVRLLSGKYLTDGREAAYFRMPALFATPTAPKAAHFVLPESHPYVGNREKSPRQTAAQKFSTAAAELLAQMHKTLSHFGGVKDAEQAAALVELYELIFSLKEQANCWDFRPAWQLSCALELLLKRLADKPKDATPSTILTIGSALDLLDKLCKPGVRSDLVISPPIEVLAVDDDLLCLRAVVFALEKAEMKPDVAQNGQTAIALATEKSYDAIFMDVQMPLLDGLTACSEIHKLQKNADTPVVFVTLHSDFETRSRSSLAGGADFMVKPFLVFEITVKALTLAMRKRLEPSFRRDSDNSSRSA
jgi:CheY-like chemotaxis protein